jgi:hypothetical protein
LGTIHTNVPSHIFDPDSKESKRHAKYRLYLANALQTYPKYYPQSKSLNDYSDIKRAITDRKKKCVKRTKAILQLETEIQERMGRISRYKEDLEQLEDLKGVDNAIWSRIICLEGFESPQPSPRGPPPKNVLNLRSSNLRKHGGHKRKKPKNLPCLHQGCPVKYQTEKTRNNHMLKCKKRPSTTPDTTAPSTTPSATPNTTAEPQRKKHKKSNTKPKTPKRKCKGVTRKGTPCKLTSANPEGYCFRHERKAILTDEKHTDEKKATTDEKDKKATPIDEKHTDNSDDQYDSDDQDSVSGDDSDGEHSQQNMVLNTPHTWSRNDESPRNIAVPDFTSGGL